MRTLVKPAHAILMSMLVSASVFANTADSPSWPQISAVNQVRFVDSRFDAESFVGNGFLLNYRSRTYAVTAKHVLLMAKTDAMKTIELDGQLKSWRMQVNGDPSQYIELGRLINTDPKEALDMTVIERDWLVFEVRENRSKLVPLTLSENEKAAPGDVLYAIGCSYARQKKCRQDSYSGRLLAYAPHNLLVQLDDVESELGGLSGAPVVDAKQGLVGIVSNFMPNPNGKGDVFAPASLDYLRAVLESDHSAGAASPLAKSRNEP